MTTGLPPLAATPTRREWTLFLAAAVERVRREARAGPIDAAESRGRGVGAERLAELVLSCLPPGDK